jgi:hypothetical protein
MRALLQITIETDETTDKLKAPTVPSWNFWPSLIFTSIQNHSISLIQIYQNPKTSIQSTHLCIKKKTHFRFYLKKPISDFTQQRKPISDFA